MTSPAQEKLLARILCDLFHENGAQDPMADAIRILEAAREDNQIHLWKNVLDRQVSGEPLNYVLGKQTFLGVELIVVPGALVPRSETELLGNTAIDLLLSLSSRRSSDDRMRVIDMCCGSGNLACGIANAVSSARVWAGDLSAVSVELARCNAARLGFATRIEVVQGDLFAPLANRGLEGTIDAIVCNPPYISSGRLEKEAAKLLRYEPREAFDGGPYGASIYQRVVKDALSFLRADGWLLFEIGQGQHRLVASLFHRMRAYAPVEFVANANGEPRVAMARKRPAAS